MLRLSIPISLPNLPRIVPHLQGSTYPGPSSSRKTLWTTPRPAIDHSFSGLWLRVLPLLDSAWGWPLPPAQGTAGPGTQEAVEELDPSSGLCLFFHKESLIALVTSCHNPLWLELCCL